MADEVKNTKKPEEISMSVDAFQKAIEIAITRAMEASGKSTAEAIIESKKPYIDPRAEENNRRMREQMKVTSEREKISKRRDRQSCPHVQGSNNLSDFQGLLGSFVIHTFDTGLRVGLCSNCGKQISSLRPEDAQYFHKKQGHRPSASGQRFFADPLGAMNSGITLED